MNPSDTEKAEAATTPAPRRGELKRLSYTHDAMIDVILQEPTVNNTELAELFGYSPGWVSRILCSDSFQARLAERKTALVDPIIAQSVNQRLQAVTAQALDIVQEKLTAEQSASYAIQALGIAASSLGLGGKQSGR